MARAFRTVVAALLVIAAACLAGGCRPKATPQVAEASPPPAATTSATATSKATQPATEAPSPAPDADSTAEVQSPSPEAASACQGDREVYRSGLIEAEQGVLEDLEGASVYHIEIEILDDPAHLVGHEAVCYTNREEVPLADVYFRLYPNVAGGTATVSALTVDGKAVEPALELEKSAMRIALPDALQPGEAILIEMDYVVTVPTDLGGTYGVFGYTEGVLALDEAYPLIPVYDDEGWNVELPGGTGDVTYLDASFYLVQVKAPGDLTLVASGVEINGEVEDGYQIVTFAAGPARDFYLAASDRYERISSRVRDTTINSYAFAEHAERSAYALQVATTSLAGFNARLGVYPYTELDVLAVPMNAGGIEYPGAIGMSLALYDPSAEVSGLPSRVVLEFATAHEVAHQWFYNVVGNDQVDDPWLDEAVVQYVTYLYYVDLYGERNAQGYRDSWVGRWERVGHADIPIGMPARDYEPAEYGAIVYGRGPLFVEALAERMGSDAFGSFLRDYYESHKWSIGTPEAFQRMAEEHCQCELDDLFVDWVYGP